MRNNCLLVLIGSVLCVSQASALPFNDDMVKTKYLRTGSTVRMPPEGSVAVGTLEARLTTKDDAVNMKNPVPTSADSVARGKRLFEANCTACHGYYTDKGLIPGVVGQKSIMAGPEIGGALYKDRPDGLFFGTIYFGGMAVMPPVGFKMAQSEAWDIVNYIRDLQKGK